MPQRRETRLNIRLLHAGTTRQVPVSELDKAAALSSRNLHVHQFSKLTKHIPQVLVAYGWIQASNEYLPTQAIHTACDQRYQVVRSNHFHSWVSLLEGYGLTTSYNLHPTARPQINPQIHKTRQTTTIPTAKLVLQTKQKTLDANSQSCCSGRCPWGRPAEMARGPRTLCK